MNPFYTPLEPFWTFKPEDTLYGVDSNGIHPDGMHGSSASSPRDIMPVAYDVVSSSPTSIADWQEIPSSRYSVASPPPNIPPCTLQCMIEQAMQDSVERSDAPAFIIPATGSQGPAERKVKKATIRFGVRPTYGSSKRRNVT